MMAGKIVLGGYASYVQVGMEALGSNLSTGVQNHC